VGVVISAGPHPCALAEGLTGSAHNASWQLSDENRELRSFDHHLLIPGFDYQLRLPTSLPAELCEFELNPRYLRGSDFLMRYSQGRWAEETVMRAFGASAGFRAVGYGPSSVAPSEPREMEEYFEKLDKANVVGKRPDLLLLRVADYSRVRSRLEEIGPQNVPFLPDDELRFLLSRAVAAIEVENSLWVAREMPHYGKAVTLKELVENPRRFRKPETKKAWEEWTENVREFCGDSEERWRLRGFTKSAKVPTVIVKEEDLQPLLQWREQTGIPIYVFHLFYDEGYFIGLDWALELINAGVVPPTRQTFYAPGGPTTEKAIYKIWYTLARPLGRMVEPPTMTARFVKDKNGHVLPYVHFSGGRLVLSRAVMEELECLDYRGQ